ncbi:MAG TPA: benzoyl-CoA reductase subunit D [Pseudomonadota bacterium]|jgi:benzoyl-CoA reductase subunit D|nr:benzoyl-CoA reductase subunit D [Pseudomonadota bacterium]
MIFSAGIDVGSSAVKVAIARSPKGSGRQREGAEVLAQVVERTRRREEKMVLEQAWQRALQTAGVKQEQLHYIATTGEGELVTFRTGHFYGMTAHARGAIFLDPEARAALDAGALHARAIRFDDRSRVLDYRMTSQCASGSGQFLENIARYLGVTLDEVGTLSVQGGNPEKVSGICAVLAETDVINMVSRGITTPNILRGIHESMSGGFAKLLKSSKAHGVILLTGGLAADVGLTECLKHALKKQAHEKGGETQSVNVRTHPHSVFAGAIGAALWGAYRHEKLQRLSA